MTSATVSSPNNNQKQESLISEAYPYAMIRIESTNGATTKLNWRYNVGGEVLPESSVNTGGKKLQLPTAAAAAGGTFFSSQVPNSLKTYQPPTVEIFSIRWSMDNSYLATCHGDGCIRLFDGHNSIYIYI